MVSEKYHKYQPLGSAASRLLCISLSYTNLQQVFGDHLDRDVNLQNHLSTTSQTAGQHSVLKHHHSKQMILRLLRKLPDEFATAWEADGNRGERKMISIPISNTHKG